MAGESSILFRGTTLNTEPMELEQFPEVNVTYAKDQPEYRPLPCYRQPNDPQGQIVCCWRLTWRERLSVLCTGQIWHHVMTFNQPLQPQLLMTEKPQIPKIEKV